MGPEFRSGSYEVTARPVSTRGATAEQATDQIKDTRKDGVSRSSGSARPTATQIFTVAQRRATVPMGPAGNVPMDPAGTAQLRTRVSRCSSQETGTVTTMVTTNSASIDPV